MALLEWVVRWSLRNRPIILVAMVLFMAIGARAVVTLPIDAVPDVTSVQVQIITSAPALSPTEVEQYISIPTERAVSGIPHSNEVRSISQYGLSVVTVVFNDDTNIYFARQLVGERMVEIQNAVPSQYGKPEIGPISSALGEVFQFVVQNDRLSLMEREEILEWSIAPALRTVPGVVEVNSLGGENRQYQVILDPKRLQAARVSLAEVVSALEKSNANAGGGYIEHNREQFVIGTSGLVKNLDDLRRVVIGATPDGTPITIATVGDAQFGPRLRRGAATADGKGEVVVGVALMLLGENARTVTSAIKTKLAAIQSSLPPGTTIEPFYDRSILVDRTIRTVTKNLLEGALLVIAVLFVLLGDLRAGIVVAAVIPLSMLFAISVMNAFGLSGNLMSLGAIDFGLIVDGAVIIVENTVRRLSEKQAQSAAPLSKEERLHVIEEATLEVRQASVFGEAIIAIVYVPVLSLTALEGKLFRPMATTVLLALGGAFILSLTLVPVLASYLVRPTKKVHETRLLQWAHTLYVPAFRAAMRHSKTTLALGVASLAIGVLLFTRVGAEFIPQLDEGDLLYEARRLPGVALSESVATSLRMERRLLSIPEIAHVVSKTGSPALGNDSMGIHETDVYIDLKAKSSWRKGLTRAGLAREISEKVESTGPEISGALTQPIQMRTNELVAGIKSDVAVILYGHDIEELRRLGDAIAKIVGEVPGAVDVRVEQVAGLRYLRVVPDRAKLARYGLTIADVNELTESMAVGHDAGEVLEAERRFAIVVKTLVPSDGDLDALRSLPLKSASGQIVPLGDVAELFFEDGPAQVSRASQSRRLTVEFNVRDRDLLSVVSDARTRVSANVAIPVNYRAEWGGQFEHYTQAKTRLMVVVPMAFALILFLLWLAFNSLRAAIVIFLNVPFAVVGGVAALWLRDIPFSISAGVGFIALFGVAVLNGLVVVSFARHIEQNGASHVESIRQAAEMRLRPVLMTALVASFGFLPMALSTEPGSEVQRPLATVVIGGILTTTLLTLFFLPVVYAQFGGRMKATQPVAA